MSTILVHSRSGPDSKLHLEVLVERPNADFEVEVLVRPRDSQGDRSPEGYFDLFGSVTDETFVRPPQGELPPPAEF